jgi:hypothetical protein
MIRTTCPALRADPGAAARRPLSSGVRAGS